MSIAGQRIKHVVVELRHHAPFTMVGALLGLGFMLFFRGISTASGHTLFAVFHPSHVFLSAMVTASLFKLHRKKASLLLVLVIGYVGSIGIATLSDSVMPFLGERMLGLHVPGHHESHRDPTEAAHPHEEADEGENHMHDHEDEEPFGIHLGFIEEWYIVNPAALLGILLAFFLPRTRLPHASHVLISTWASSAHVLMNTEDAISGLVAGGLFFVLFFSVWLPCCISDIVFPVLFVEGDEQDQPHAEDRS